MQNHNTISKIKFIIYKLRQRDLEKVMLLNFILYKGLTENENYKVHETNK